MPVSELLMEGLRLMLLGMGIVFIFLIVLVFALYGMSRLAAAIQPQHGVVSTVAAEDAPQPVDHVAEEELIAVIGAAITRYRSTRK